MRQRAGRGGNWRQSTGRGGDGAGLAVAEAATTPAWPSQRRRQCQLAAVEVAAAPDWPPLRWRQRRIGRSYGPKTDHTFFDPHICAGRQSTLYVPGFQQVSADALQAPFV